MMTFPGVEVGPAGLGSDACAWLELVDQKERRSTLRIDTSREAKLRMRGSLARQVVLSDVSHHGCRVGAPHLSPGDQVLITLPGLESKMATVAWSNATHAGLLFVQALHPAVATHIATATSPLG
jgi:hypothetical protein